MVSLANSTKHLKEIIPILSQKIDKVILWGQQHYPKTETG